MADLSPDQLERYGRHVVMDDVGPDGQSAFLDGSVLVVGIGGLGSPVVQYLAAAGVGRLTLVDDDVVERSNLQRQVVHGEADLGRPKVDSAADFVASRNPDVAVETVDARFSPENATALVADHDVVVDASDNFPTRYLVNDACTLAGTPFTHGAVYRFEGQVTSFTGDGPCYRCLFPEAPPDGTVPNCATAGVLGVVPGTVGTLQATDVLNALRDELSLPGRLLVYDAESIAVETVPVERDPTCPVCGEEPVITSLNDVNYAGQCGIADAD